MKISQKIYDKKHDKYRISMLIAECSNKLSTLEINHCVFFSFIQGQREYWENKKKLLEKAFQNYIQEESFDGKKTNTSTNKVKGSFSALSKEFLTVQMEYERQMKENDQKIAELDSKFDEETRTVGKV